MPLDVPFKLGRFLVGEDGRLFPDPAATAPVLHFSWHGLPVRVELTAGDAEGGDGSLALTAMIGRVPSTAGGQGLRAGALAQVAQLRGAMQPGWRAKLLPDHCVSIATSRTLALPASAADLLTEVTCFLLGLAPYLDVLAGPDAGLATAGGASRDGMVNT